MKFIQYKNPYYDPTKFHHTPTGFRNRDQVKISKTAFQRWQRERHRLKKPRPPKSGYGNFIRNWWQPADFSILGNAVWWLGHATVLFRLDGRTVLTDPIFSERVSPIGFVGPKRKTPPAAHIDQLPPIDVVVISHNHYDHLDLPSIRHLAQQSDQTIFLVPLGLKKWFKRYGISRVEEFDWWESVDTCDLTLTLVPAQHWSRRGLRDANRTLWGGWIISQHVFGEECKNYYFAGDTAYSPYLSEIGKEFPIELSAIPIGAYEPRWFMGAMHIDPVEAVQLHQDLKSKKSLGMHWATFELADESIDDPQKLLHQVLDEKGLSRDDFVTLKLGGHLLLD